MAARANIAAMKPWIVAALGAFVSTGALADYLDRPPLFHCDAGTSHVVVWFEPQDAPPGVAGVELEVPASASSGRTTPAGSAYRAPGKTRVQRCGRLRLHLRAAFLNVDPEGELGVFEFPAIEVSDGPRRLLARTGLAICDLPPSRWEVVGRCPDDYAVAVDVTAATRDAPARVRLVRAHNAEDGLTVARQVEER